MHINEVGLAGQKSYAVAILAAVWAGAQIPQEFIDHAEAIRSKMVADGTWESA